MSFKQLFARLTQTLTDFQDSYSKRVQEYPVSLEQQLGTREKQLTNFVDRFQNDLDTINRNIDRDCKIIENLHYEGEQKVVHCQLIEDSTKMEQNIIDKLNLNIQNLQKLQKQFQARALASNENINRNELSIEEQLRKVNNNSLNPIKIDKQNSKMIIKVDGSSSRVYEVLYNKKQDKFSVGPCEKQVVQAIHQFNFHRDLNRLYNHLQRV